MDSTRLGYKLRGDNHWSTQSRTPAASSSAFGPIDLQKLPFTEATILDYRRRYNRLVPPPAAPAVLCTSQLCRHTPAANQRSHAFFYQMALTCTNATLLHLSTLPHSTFDVCHASHAMHVPLAMSASIPAPSAVLLPSLVYPSSAVQCFSHFCLCRLLVLRAVCRRPPTPPPAQRATRVLPRKHWGRGGSIQKWTEPVPLLYFHVEPTGSDPSLGLGEAFIREASLSLELPHP